MSQVQLYELAGADRDRRFSPFVWRARMALAHKGVAYEGIPITFSEKDRIAFSGQPLVPVLVDHGRPIPDSWAIADHLEATRPDAPTLFGGPQGRALSRFYGDWAMRALGRPVITLIMMDVHDSIDEADRPYFRESRERRFGRKLESFRDEHGPAREALAAALAPLRDTLSVQPFLGGESPLYADYCVFGVFQWARTVSATRLIEPTDPIADWVRRLCGLHGGEALRGSFACAA